MKLYSFDKEGFFATQSKSTRFSQIQRRTICKDKKKIYFTAGKTMQANTNESISAHTLPV